ncbi:ABC transporter substrate-binding protein [Pseudosulfitobacter pseudonitzschiae]|uniref:ABC transporter substrate-binding protein n=1 Tax=Pseudosulfitobacter pseudonitzschiae TaxID=1402135 RepID=UPI001AFC971F|nr:ABC transporter substrate-binding protein [Pseudosulfitobacter pseudonitzschiae]MBM1816355.1 amino acid ABC transporter substrate-binding protein [Pseudosulfitobacter pseudonitzschiae]MBM1832953.1 amino acid ABC transporter substrate-binding protein [Pseudosulfitobacter pseudonitzschiae]MBM1837821.1 amino acid ABC transporter substrate-binding protein [Pseudosulfitobacter pseudonitzschiae]MBM1843082.1 amino acid ABC transporter substrate-binding protein [Pseudosulfitobacter pseudonitzschiae]
MKLRSLAIAGALALCAAQSQAEDLTVGVTTTGVPFTFVDTATQQPTGAMVDLAAAIAEDLQMTPDFAVSQFSALIPALQTGKIDVISAGMFATDKRKEVVDFSTPVYSYGDVAFVKADDEGSYQLDDFAGEVVGAQIGTTFADQLQAKGIFSEVKLYDSLVDIMRDVQLGRIKAGFGDKPIIAYQIAQNPNLGVKLVEGYTPMGTGEVALAVSKENPELLEKVNASIAEMEKSGELAEIFGKYGL